MKTSEQLLKMSKEELGYYIIHLETEMEIQRIEYEGKLQTAKAESKRYRALYKKWFDLYEELLDVQTCESRCF